MIRLLYGLFVILVAAVSLSAQTVDVRVSPPDPVSTVYPDWAKIQTSCVVGDRTMVVWGSSALDSTGSVVPVLVAQFVQNEIVVGQPIEITSTRARPSTSVAIVPLKSHFLVLWRDSRVGDHGIYTVRLDSLGSPFGSETRLAPDILKVDSAHPVRFIGDTVHGGRLFWHTETVPEQIYSVRIDSSGNPIGDVVKMGFGLLDILHYRELPGVWVVRLPNSPSWIVTSDGSMPFDSMSKGRFNVSHHLKSDSSLIALEGHSLQFYRHYYDARPTDSIVVPIIDSASGTTGVMWLDSSGAIQVFTAHLTPADGNPDPGFVGRFAYRRIKRTMVYPDGSFSAPEIIALDSSWNGGLYPDRKSGSYNYINAVNSRQGLKNSALLEWTYRFEDWIEGTIVSSGYSKFFVSVDSEGVVHLNNSGFEDPSAGIPQPRIVRRDSDSESIVDLYTPVGIVALSVPLAQFAVNVSERMPGIILRQGQVIVSYLPSINIYLPSSLRWNPDDGKEGVPFSSIIPLDLNPTKSAYVSGLEKPVGTYNNTEFAYLRRENGIVVLHMRSRIDVFEFYNTHQKDQTHTYAASVDLMLPDEWGYWTTDRTDIRSIGDYRPTNYFHFGSRFRTSDPNRNELVYSIEWFRNPLDQLVTGYDIFQLRGVPNGSGVSHPDWSINLDTRFLESRAIVPNGPNEFVALLADRAVRVRNGKSIDSVSVPIGPILFSARLLGPYYLLMQSLPGDTLGRSLLFYDIDNGLVFNKTIHLASKTSDYFLVQNPRDSVVGIIYGGDSGVHAAFLSVSDRRLLKEDSLLSQTRARAINPAGLIWKNILYVVWEDYRRGVPDIYSNRMVLPESWKNFSGRDQKGGPPSDQRPPIIVDGIWSVSLPLSEQEAQGPLRIELYNVQGQLLHAEDRDLDPSLGTLPISLSLVGNPPGVYFVVVRGVLLDHPRSYLTILQ